MLKRAVWVEAERDVACHEASMVKLVAEAAGRARADSLMS